MTHPPIKLRVVILTGTRDNQNVLVAGTGVQSKVMLPVGGQPMVVSVMKNAHASKYRPEIFISTGDPDIASLDVGIPFKTLPSEDKAVRSFLMSLERLPDDPAAGDRDYVLFISGDHPLLTTEMIDYFIDGALARDLTLAAAVVNRKLVSKEYPESKRTYFPAKGDAYSGGNMYLINKPRFRANPEFLEAMDNNRKKPLKSLKYLNIPVIILILLRQLDIHAITKHASKVLGCKGGVIVMPFAECCMDVDKPSDKVIAEEILARRRAGGSPVAELPATDMSPSAMGA